MFMKKALSVLLAVVLLCVSAFPCFALWNGKYYKLGIPPAFSEINTSEGHMEWKNEKTGSSIIINLEDNTKMLYYLGADEQTQKEFVESFISQRQVDVNNDTINSGYYINYGTPEYSEKKFDHVSGFYIGCETAKEAKDGSYSVSFDSDFYFFSIKELVVKLECVLTTDEDKAAVENMLNDFELDGTLLTAENVMDFYPSPMQVILPLVAVILIIVLVIIIVKRKNKAKAEAKKAQPEAEA